MATCEMCGGRSFYENECRDCGYEKEESENIRGNNIELGSHEGNLGQRLHPELNQPPKRETESSQGVFPFLKRK